MGPLAYIILGIGVFLISVLLIIFLYLCSKRICGFLKDEEGNEANRERRTVSPNNAFLDIESQHRNDSDYDDLYRTLRNLRYHQHTSNGRSRSGNLSRLGPTPISNTGAIRVKANRREIHSSTSRTTRGNNSRRAIHPNSENVRPPAVYTVERDNIIVNRSRAHPTPNSNTSQEANNTTKTLAQSATKKNPITIAVDATPFRIGGYCVNANENEIIYYSLKSTLLSDIFKRNDTPSDFEMKNLLCALVTFQAWINRYQKVQVYTDNWAINDSSDDYARAVRCFLNHLSTCHQVQVMNPKSMHVHRHKKPQLFDKWIAPADHLSRNRQAEFLEAMKRYASYTTSQISVNEVGKLMRFARLQNCPNDCPWYSQFRVVKY